jgi:hypothetical protein
MQQSALQLGVRYLHPVGQNKTALELPGGDSTMQIDPLFVVFFLLAPDHQLSGFDRDGQVGLPEARNRQRDAKTIRIDLFDIVGGIAIIARLDRALDQSIKLIKAEQEGVRGEGNACHLNQVLVKATLRPAPNLATRNIYGSVASAAQGRPPTAPLRRTAARIDSPSIFWNCGLLNNTPTMQHSEIMRIRLEMLQQEHRDLDAAIAALDLGGRGDALTLRRLKKQKLALKDRIAKLEDDLTPDIIA